MKKATRFLADCVMVALCLTLFPAAHASNGLTEVTNSPDIDIAAMNDRLEEDFWLICMSMGDLFTRENWRAHESVMVNYSACLYDEQDRSGITVEEYRLGSSTQLKFRAQPFFDFLSREYGIDPTPKADTLYDQYGNLLYKDGYYYTFIHACGIPFWEITIDHVYYLQPHLYYVQFTESTSIEGGEPDILHSYAILHQDSADHYQLYECGKSASISPKRLQYRLSAQAAPTGMRVTLDGSPISLEAYEIGGNNFVKLRDIAMLLNGTDKQFSVSYDGKTKAISLRTNESYTPVGGERKANGTQSKLAAPAESAVWLDGKELHLTAYAIEGNNFVKLRDLGQALDFGVKWNRGANTVEITSQSGYKA